MRYRAFALLFGGSSLVTLAASAQGTTSSISYPPVAILNSQSRRLQSRIVGQEYEVKVWLPQGYDTSTKRYPVVYLLDGDLLFAAATDIARFLAWGGFMPEVVIVSPAYGSVDGPASHGTNMRDRDYSVFPTQGSYTPNGGTTHLRFLAEELMPYVERELRVDPSDRTLVGGSRSGEFTIYTFLTAPDLFHRYVMIDSYQRGYLPLEDSLFARRRELPKKLFVSSRFPHGDVWRFAERLRSRGYAGLDVEYATLNAHHFATPAEGLTKGLKAVFSPRSVYETLLPIAERSSVDSVVAQYRALKMQSPNGYLFDESQLVDLGAALVFMQRPADALRVFQLNLEAYPRSGDTYSRLGSTYEQLGDRARAVESYRQAVRLNGNRYATDALKRLEPR